MAWFSLAAAVALLTAGCASSVVGTVVTGSTTGNTTVTGSATPPTTVVTASAAAADWNPQQRRTIAVDIHQSTATIHVGERLQFTPRDSDTVEFSVTPTELRSITWYGNDLTFIGLAPGTATLSIFNANKHFDCPNGPCAHPNAPLIMTVTVLAGSSATESSPSIPAPEAVTTVGSSRTVHLRVGQQLLIPSDIETLPYSSEEAGFPLDGELGHLQGAEGAVTLVAATPGRQMIGLITQPAGSSVTPTELTIVIDA